MCDVPNHGAMNSYHTVNPIGFPQSYPGRIVDYAQRPSTVPILRRGDRPDSVWRPAEFSYTPFRWNEAHRFIAVRPPQTLEPEARQRALFTFKRYTYHRVLVTNLALSPEAV